MFNQFAHEALNTLLDAERDFDQLWFWSRWFRTKEYLRLRLALTKATSAVSQYIEHTTMLDEQRRQCLEALRRAESKL
jgi:hypothetical protein